MYPKVQSNGTTLDSKLTAPRACDAEAYISPCTGAMRRRKRTAFGASVDTARKVADYEAWLRHRGVTWHEAVQTTSEGVVAGLGCRLSAKVQSGEVLFRIPRRACLGAQPHSPADEEPTCGDTQQPRSAWPSSTSII